MVNWTQETKKALHCATASLSPGTRSLPQEFISFFLINFLNASLNLEGKKKIKHSRVPVLKVQSNSCFNLYNKKVGSHN